MGNVADEIRRLAALLLVTPPDSAASARYRSELKAATKTLEAQQRNWNKRAEPDKHQNEARQSYRSRESDSADAFADGLNLFQAKKRDPEKKKRD